MCQSSFTSIKWENSVNAKGQEYLCNQFDDNAGKLSKPEATAARNQNSIGDRMEKKPWEKPGSVGVPVLLWPDEPTVKFQPQKSRIVQRTHLNFYLCRRLLSNASWTPHLYNQYHESNVFLCLSLRTMA